MGTTMTWSWMLPELVIKLWSLGILSGLTICGILSFLNVNRGGNLFSSQDSLGATVETSEKLYDDTIAQHPSTILALNHETVGSFALLIC